MKKNVIVESFIWLILGISICIESIRLKLGNFQTPGPGFLPFISGTFLWLFGLILMFSFFLKRLRKEEKLNDKEISKKENWKKLLLTLIALFGYCFLLEPLGFIISSFIFLFFLFKLTEPKKWVKPLVFSGTTVVLVYFIFIICLKGQFPRGIFRF